MGIYFHCINTQRYAHLLLSLLLLLSSAQLRCSAEGRALLKLLDVSKGGGGAEIVRERAMMIGSRPPRCAGRCPSCGHCEAVQVPAVPQERSRAGRWSTTVVASRGDYSSNYKPLNWKCRCGVVFFNP